MVTRPFSSVIGMLPIRGFKKPFFISWANVGAKKKKKKEKKKKKNWSPLIDNLFNDGFWAKISIFFFQLNEMRNEAKT